MLETVPSCGKFAKSKTLNGDVDSVITLTDSFSDRFV